MRAKVTAKANIAITGPWGLIRLPCNSIDITPDRQTVQCLYRNFSHLDGYWFEVESNRDCTSEINTMIDAIVAGGAVPSEVSLEHNGKSTVGCSGNMEDISYESEPGGAKWKISFYIGLVERIIEEIYPNRGKTNETQAARKVPQADAANRARGA